MPEVSTSEIRKYGFPTVPLMFSHFGLAVSPGGFNGSNEAWQEAQAMPTRNGGSIEPSARRPFSLSLNLASLAKEWRYPPQLARPPFTSIHRTLSKRGLGNFRKPMAPVEVPKARSQAD